MPAIMMMNGMTMFHQLGSGGALTRSGLLSHWLVKDTSVLLCLLDASDNSREESARTPPRLATRTSVRA